MKYSVKDIAKILHGKILRCDFPKEIIREASVNTREIISPEGILFFCLKGENFDGHDFILQAIGTGIKNLVVSKKISVQSSTNFILVNDTLKSLRQFGAYHRFQYKYPVIGITGSNGKTTVKEWLYLLLNEKFSIVKNPKSYNSQIGVPLSVLQMEKHHTLGIFEAGISKMNEMKNLEPVIKPDIGIITNIGEAHADGFVSKEEKLKQKLQLFKNAKTIIYNSDYEIIHEKIPAEKRFSFGSRNDDKIFVKEKTEKQTGWQVKIIYEKKEYSFFIPVTGFFAYENAVHCVCAGLALGVEMKYILEKIYSLASIPMRMELITSNPDIVIYNDAYNADPSSIQNAVNVLESSRAFDKKQIIISDLTYSRADVLKHHKNVLWFLSSRKIDCIHTIGKNFSTVQQKEKFHNVKSYSTKEEFLSRWNEKTFHRSVVLIKGARKYELEQILPYLSHSAHATQLKINLNRLSSNLNYFRRFLKSETKIMAMVKAASYGGGEWEIAQELVYHRVDYLAVAFAEEGIMLRGKGIKTPVMVMNANAESLPMIVKYKLEAEIFDLDTLKNFERQGRYLNAHEIPLHIKIDTGMHRLGFSPNEIDELISFLETHKVFKVKSVLSHLAAADDAKHDEYTLKQIKLFSQLTEKMEKRLGKFMKHILNTAGLLRFPDYQMDIIRLGIGLYGISPLQNSIEELQEVLSLQTNISQIKKYEEIVSVGYSRGQFTKKKKSLVATIPVGYADGLSRQLGNGKGNVLVRGKHVPIIGNVCMDMCMIDVTEIPDAKVGDEVVLFGEQGKEKISASEVAEKYGTIPYEIISTISGRVKRVFYRE